MGYLFELPFIPGWIPGPFDENIYFADRPHIDRTECTMFDWLHDAQREFARHFARSGENRSQTANFLQYVEAFSELRVHVIEIVKNLLGR